MAKEELWGTRWSAFWVEHFGAFPVRRGSLDRETLRTAERWLSQGVSVVMFPEGGRSAAGMRRGLPGAASLAARLRVPVLPVGIAGTDKLRRVLVVDASTTPGSR